MKKARVTLDDVAKEAGVSPITVSRAIREPAMVAEQNRIKIEQAIAKLGYVPNRAARFLASGRSQVIGVVIPSVTNNVFADVLRGIYEKAADTSYELQLANTRYSPLLEEAAITLFASQRPAGLIVTGNEQTATARRALAELDCPVVQIMETAEDPIGTVFGFSHYDAARAGTQHLLEQGYRRLGFLGARMDPRTLRRLQGFRAVASEVGAYDETRIVTTVEASSVTKGVELFSSLLAQAPDVDAILCNNDDLAVGALFEAQRRRLRVPEDLGICGFNDLEMMAAAEPALTSIRTPRREMGHRAMETITSSLSDGASKPTSVDLGFQLMIRRSTLRSDPR